MTSNIQLNEITAEQTELIKGGAEVGFASSSESSTVLLTPYSGFQGGVRVAAGDIN